MRLRDLLAIAALGCTWAGCATAAPDPGRQFSDFLQAQYSAQERACRTESDVEKGWCYTAAAKRRDAAIRQLIGKTPSAAIRGYQAAWLKYRAERCAPFPEGSGSGTIAAECVLDMAIARQIDLQTEMN